jgi:LysR family transcriptional regulator, regulator for bpeEF and oprC
VSRRLGAVHLVTCAAPAYVARRGKPAVPDELSHHDCVRDRNFRRGARWPLIKDGRTVDVAIKGRLTVNDITATHRATLAGAGIGLLASYIVKEGIAPGRLVRLLEDHRAAELPVSAVYPHRMYLAAKVQGFVDGLAERVARYGLGEAPPVREPGPAPVRRRR